MQKPQHPLCFKIVPTPFKPGVRFLVAVLCGILQFAVVLAVVAIFSTSLWLISVPFPISHDTREMLELVPKGFKALSSSIAMYCLTIFYFELLRNEDLRKPFRTLDPEFKFVCLKGILMLPLVQGFAISAMAKARLFDDIR